MRKRLVLLRIFVFSICIIASTILLMVPHKRHMSGSDVAVKTQYGFPLAWRTYTPKPANTIDPGFAVNAEPETVLDSQKLIINILLFGSVTTFLLFATAALEKRQ